MARSEATEQQRIMSTRQMSANSRFINPRLQLALCEMWSVLRPCALRTLDPPAGGSNRPACDGIEHKVGTICCPLPMLQPHRCCRLSSQSSLALCVSHGSAGSPALFVSSAVVLVSSRLPGVGCLHSITGFGCWVAGAGGRVRGRKAASARAASAAPAIQHHIRHHCR